MVLNQDKTVCLMVFIMETWATRKKWDRGEILRNMKKDKIECVVTNYMAGVPVKKIVGLCGIPIVGIIYDIIDAHNLPRRRGHYKRPRMENTWSQYAELLTGKESLYKAFKQGRLSAETYMRIRDRIEEVKKRNLDEYIILAGHILDNWFRPVEWKLKIINEKNIDPVLLEEATALLFYSVPKTVRRQFYKKIRTRTSFYRRGRSGNVKKEVKKKIDGELYKFFKAMIERKHHPAPNIWGLILGVNARKLDEYLLDKVYWRLSHEKKLERIRELEKKKRRNKLERNIEESRSIERVVDASYLVGSHHD